MPGRHLVEQRLEEVVVAPIDQRDVHRQSSQVPTSGQAAETAAHDDHPMPRWGRLRGPGHEAASSRAMSRLAASMSARWVNACGKFPRCCPVVTSISSAYRWSGPANDSSFSNRARARVLFADHGQCRHQPERADGERALLARQAVVGGVDPIAQHQTVLGQLVGDGEHGGLDAVVVGRQEAHDRDQEERRVEVLGAVELRERTPVVEPLLDHLGLDRVGRGLPLLDAFGVVALAGEPHTTVGRDPAHDLRCDEVLRVPAHLPDALVGLGVARRSPGRRTQLSPPTPAGAI